MKTFDANRTNRTRAFQIGIALSVAATTACMRCPESEQQKLIASVPSPETKNDGVDLKGWTYQKVVSEKSNETHYYYHFPSDKPDAPTFVLLHGLIFDGKNFLEFKPLAKHFNLIAYDLPNESSFYRGHTDDFADLLSDFFEAMKLKHIYLGGVSLGGQVSMIFASKKRAVTLDGLALISTDMAKDERELKKSRRLAKTTERITDREAGKTLCIVTKLVNKKKEEAGDKLASLDNFVLRQVDFYNQVLDTSIDMTTPIALSSIEAPTVIIHGDADTVVSIDDAKGLVDVIPDATFHVIEGGEHAIAYSHAADIVKYIEARFVKR